MSAEATLHFVRSEKKKALPKGFSHGSAPLRCCISLDPSAVPSKIRSIRFLQVMDAQNHGVNSANNTSTEGYGTLGSAQPLVNGIGSGERMGQSRGSESQPS